MQKKLTQKLYIKTLLKKLKIVTFIFICYQKGKKK